MEATNTCLLAAAKSEHLTNPAEVYKKLRDSMAIIADVCHEIGLIRRRALKSHVKEQYRALCGMKMPITTLLFGDDLPTQANEVGEEYKLSNNMTGGKNDNKRSQKSSHNSSNNNRRDNRDRSKPRYDNRNDGSRSKNNSYYKKYSPKKQDFQKSKKSGV